MRVIGLLVLGLMLLLPGRAQAIDVVSGELVFTNGAIGLTVPVDETKGGTGQTTYATGDVLYASGADTLSKLSGNPSSKLFLTMDTNVPSWAAIIDSDVPDTITIDHTTTGTLTLDQDFASTVEGRAAWDATNDLLKIGNSASVDTFYPGGTMTDGQLCTFSSAGQEIVCNSSASTPFNSTVFFSTIGTLGTGSQTVYAIPGDVSATEGAVETPVSATTWTNLRCESDAVPGGTGITITGRSGACGTLSASSLVCPIGAASTTCSNSNTMSPTLNQCMSFSIVGGTTTTAVHVTCSVERSA